MRTQALEEQMHLDGCMLHTSGTSAAKIGEILIYPAADECAC